jgi:hypothetical protein
MTNTHSPGPWIVIGSTVCSGNTRVVCYEEGADNWDANAGLIAAAPDMLAALRECVAAEDSESYVRRSNAIESTRSFTSSRGEQSESARHSIVVYGPHAIEVGETVKHGSCVHIEGKLSTRTTTLADGRKQEAIQILAQTVQLLMPEDHHGD